MVFDTSTEEDLDLNAVLFEIIGNDVGSQQLHVSNNAETRQLRVSNDAEAHQLPAVSAPQMHQCDYSALPIECSLI